MSLFSDLTLLQAETTFYEAVRSISEKFNLLQEHSHLINFTDDSEQAIAFRKTFYQLLKANSEITLKFSEYFESLCQLHGCEYKD